MAFQIQNGLINFTGATVNINALADSHGKLGQTDISYQTLMAPENDAFVKEGAGKKNFLIIGGDWFISGDKKGFFSDPIKPLMKFQAEMFNKFVGKIKENFPETSAFFIPGNHEFDGGAKLFHKTIRDINADTIITNLDFEKSEAFKEAIKEGRIVKSKVNFVQDDKNPNLQHAILNVGVSPVNMKYYSKDTDGVEFIDNTDTPQKYVQPEQYEKTKRAVVEEINKFKKDYPKGVVILTCHTGVNFAENIAANAPVDLIFDGHEHKEGASFRANTPIVSMSQNLKKIVNAKIEIDDNGDVESVNIRDLRPDEKGFKSGEITEFYNELFNEDSKKKYTILPPKSGFYELSIDNVRNKNSHLANFVVDAILDEIKEKDKDVRIFALNASSIRSGFKLSKTPQVSPFEVMNCLDGINYNQAEIYTTNVTGRQLVDMILDNFLFNQADKEKNPLIHYSGIKIDRTGMLEAYSKGKIGSELCQYVTLSDTKEKLQPDDNYKIANAEKYFIKTRNEKIRELKDSSTPLGLNVIDAFKNFFEKNNEISFTPENRIY